MSKSPQPPSAADGSQATQQYQAYVVSHTHWDREWYRTFQVFRMRLVQLVDELLDLLERDPEYRYFYWDGQTVVISDYLEVRPENADRLRRAFASGRLYTGPWFVQQDGFLVSGEAIIRNLLRGRSDCRAWGTGAQVGYAPDAFGHTSQMPQILNGFGIDNAVLFRGVTTDQVDAEFMWRAPDGSEVLCIKMPDNNAYSNFFYCFRNTLADTDRGAPLDPEQVAREARELLDDCIRERPTTPNLLWMDGVDHVFAQPRTPEIIRIVNSRLGDEVHAFHSTLPAFIHAVKEANPPLKTVVGELRMSNRAWKLQALLTHTASSRMHLKQLNHACETLLEKWVEPWCAVGWMLGREYPAGLISEAWRQLLLNQPHDSICGCSVDAVHRDMLPRYEQCQQIGERLAAQAMQWIADQVDTRRQAPSSALGAVVVFNPLAWDRDGEEVEVLVELPQAQGVEHLAILDDHGNPAPAQVERLTDYFRLTQAPHDIPVGEGLTRWRVRFLGGAPSLGYRTYFVASAPEREADGLTADASTIENEALRVEATANGTVSILHKATGRVLRGAFAFEDGGDVGDGYNYRPPQQDRILYSWECAAVHIEAGRSRTRAELRIKLTFPVPARRTPDGRSKDTEDLEILVVLGLTPASCRLDARIEVQNRARDHRLRVLFPSGCAKASFYQVEQAFDVVVRPVAVPECSDWKEPLPKTGPQKTFANVEDASGGLCVINCGLPEVEVMDNEERSVAVTLLRCTGQGVGAPEEQEDGQMLGRHVFHLAILPHSSGWEHEKVWRTAHAFNAPMRGVFTGIHEGKLDAERSFLQCGADDLVVTAVKRSEDGAAIVVRAVNYGSGLVQGVFRTSLPFRRAWVARLDETLLGRLDVHSGEMHTEVPAKRIVTLMLEAPGSQ